MRWKRDSSIVPVLMFHSIGMQGIPWIWSELTEGVDTFEKILAGLVKKGFKAVSLRDLFDHMTGARRLPGNSIVLTFDDGYLDNWVNAVPLLRKYGMRGTVYVTPEFVQDGVKLRPVSHDSRERGSHTQPVEVAGFMNWEELRAVDSEGVLDVQCHALTHTWYFSGPRVVDFHRPRNINPYPWMSWNARPDRKPNYLTENQDHLVPWGQPIFEHEKSLIVRRFIPESEDLDSICAFVGANGGEEFFEKSNWRAELTSRFPVLGGAEQIAGVYESEEEHKERVLYELTESRRILERELDKQIEFLSWPGGGVDQAATGLARQAGFKSWTLSSWQKPEFRNRPGSNAHEIKRVSGHGRAFWKGRLLTTGDASWVVLRVLTHQGSLPSMLAGVFKKLGWIVATILRGRPSPKESSVAR